MADEIKKDPYSLREIFQKMELDLIASLKRNFYRHKEEELKEGFQWEQWQLVKLRNLVKYRKANKKIIEAYSQPIENAIQEVLQESFRIGEGNVDKAIEKVQKTTAEINFPEDVIDKMPAEAKASGEGMTPLKDVIDSIFNKSIELPKAAPDTNFFGVNEKKLQALHDSVKNDINKANQAILRQMDDVYRQVIYKTHVYMQSGTKTLNQAMDMATKDFLEKGINCIQYKDGKRVNIASYAEMALRTASQRVTFLGEGKKRDEWGLHLVVVSAHANTCKLCLPWQGKILIDDVYSNGSKADGDYPLLSEAMKAGLLHPNCRHTLITYFPGITQLPKVPDEKEALKNYEAEQQQRYMERQIRKWKRIEAGSCDAENVNKAHDKVVEWQERLKQHLKDSPELRRDYTRETSRIPIEETGNNDILSYRKWLKSDFSTEKRFNKHIEKHLDEYGDITPEQYLNKTRDLLAAPLGDDVEGFVSKDGFVFKYRKSTNDFAIGRADGKISTMFKPKDKYEYWLNQIKDYKG